MNGPRRERHLGVRSAALWLAVLALGCTRSGGEEPRRAASADDVAPLPGQPEELPLPELVLPDLQGEPQPLRAGDHEVTVINFWATWCVPCLKEIPELVALAHEHRDDGVRVVGIAVDSGDPADVAAFAVGHGVDYRVLLADYAWARRHFGVFGLPVTLIVDRGGTVRRRLVGPHTGAEFAAVIRPHR